MNKEITIYDLLGLIKDDKAPKMIKYKGNNYMFTGYDYRRVLTDIEKGFVEYWLIGNYNQDLQSILNEKVEILEEDKPIIKKIKINKYHFHNTNHSKLLKNQEILETKLNEVIEFLSRKEDK